jgi:thymidylate kinase
MEFPFSSSTNQKALALPLLKLRLLTTTTQPIQSCHFSKLVFKYQIAAMHGASRADGVYKSGDEAPESGVYTVIHDRHRPSHVATVFKGERFPACAQCGSLVRFALVRPATPIADDADF